MVRRLDESERAFLQQAARQRVTTYDGHTWEYFDVGKPSSSVAPLVCLPSTTGSPKIFHLQATELALKGYRIIAVQHPTVWTHEEWIHSFDRFLDALGLQQVHVYGVSLGAYLAQRYAATNPHRVASLVMTQGYCNTKPFGSKAPWLRTITYLPDFYLKKHLLEQLPRQQDKNPAHVQAVDYIADQVRKLTQQEAACLLTLQCLPCDPTSWQLGISDDKITLIDSHNETTLPPQVRDELEQRYMHAKRALIRDAGDFPFLSHYEEVSMHLQVHLRAHGVHQR